MLKDTGPIEAGMVDATPRSILWFPVLKDTGPIEAWKASSSRRPAITFPVLKDTGPIEARGRLTTEPKKTRVSGVERHRPH